MRPTSTAPVPVNTRVVAFRQRCARLSRALGFADVHLLADLGHAHVDGMAFHVLMPEDPQTQGLQLRFDLDHRAPWTPRVDPVDLASLIDIDPVLAASIELSPDGTQVYLVAHVPDHLQKQPDALADAVRSRAQTARALALQVAFTTGVSEQAPD